MHISCCYLEFKPHHFNTRNGFVPIHLQHAKFYVLYLIYAVLNVLRLIIDFWDAFNCHCSISSSLLLVTLAPTSVVLFRNSPSLSVVTFSPFLDFTSAPPVPSLFRRCCLRYVCVYCSFCVADCPFALAFYCRSSCVRVLPTAALLRPSLKILTSDPALFAAALRAPLSMCSDFSSRTTELTQFVCNTTLFARFLSKCVHRGAAHFLLILCFPLSHCSRRYRCLA